MVYCWLAPVWELNNWISMLLWPAAVAMVGGSKIVGVLSLHKEGIAGI